MNHERLARHHMVLGHTLTTLGTIALSTEEETSLHEVLAFIKPFTIKPEEMSDAEADLHYAETAEGLMNKLSVIGPITPPEQLALAAVIARLRRYAVKPPTVHAAITAGDFAAGYRYALAQVRRLLDARMAGEVPVDPLLRAMGDEVKVQRDGGGEAKEYEDDLDTLPLRVPNVPNEEQGLYAKFHVSRVDGSDKPGGKHADCTYFVLDVEHDPYARPCLLLYAMLCDRTHPKLSRDMLDNLGLIEAGEWRGPILLALLRGAVNAVECGLPAHPDATAISSRLGDAAFALQQLQSTGVHHWPTPLPRFTLTSNERAALKWCVENLSGATNEYLRAVIEALERAHKMEPQS